MVAEDLRSAVERRIFQPDQGGPLSVSVSIGMAGVDVAAGDPERLALSLVESADSLLYDAKAGGRNQVLSSS